MGRHLPKALSGERRRVKRNKTRTKQAVFIRDYINGIKGRGCQLCGYNRCLSAIEFHHVGNGKNFEMSSVGSRSLQQVKDEISRCVVICANCHCEIHAEENGFVNGGGRSQNVTRIEIQPVLDFGANHDV